MKNRTNKKVGFTLIELLVVIAIIGILSSIALINLNNARNRAQEAYALGTMENLQKAAVLCQSLYTGSGSEGFLQCDNDLADPWYGACGSADTPSANFWLAPSVGVNKMLCQGHPTVGKWPQLNERWTYTWEDGGTVDNSGLDTPFSDPITSKFRIAICEIDPTDNPGNYSCLDGGIYIYCTEAGCVKTTASTK